MTTKAKRWIGLFIGLMAVVTLGTFPAFAHTPLSLVAAATAVAPLSLQVKILTISASVYAILQGAKKFIPLSGIWAVVFNVFVSALGVVIALKPEDLFSVQTLSALLLAGLAAAGVHGTARSFSGNSSPANPAGGATAVLLVFGVLGLTGCSSLEHQAYNVIVASKAFTKSISDKHPECGTRDVNGRWVSGGNQAGVCVALSKGIAAKDLLIDAAEEYCAGSDFETGGACNAPTSQTIKSQLVSKVKAAISGYEQAEMDLRAAIK
jgi:hypothetical protein